MTEFKTNNTEIVEDVTVITEADKKGVIAWIKEHRKELIIAGIGVGTIICIVLGIKNRATLINLYEKLNSAINPRSLAIPAMDVVDCVPVIEVIETPPVQLMKVTPDNIGRVPHEVCAHLRVLPEGMKASAEKIATAAANGFDLSEGGVTWVQRYNTGAAA